MCTTSKHAVEWVLTKIRDRIESRLRHFFFPISFPFGALARFHGRLKMALLFVCLSIPNSMLMLLALIDDSMPFSSLF